MSLIYEPRGRAREYADLACNIYSGCDHACVYCYAPSATFKKYQDFIHSAPRANYRENLLKECKKWSGEKKQVLLSFTCDPYQKIDEVYKDTRYTIETLHEYGFPICVLTKGGKRALRDLDLFTTGDAFASTMTFVDDKKSKQWEPGAALPKDRMDTIKTFFDHGIETWVSLEPTIEPEQSLEIVRQTHAFVNLYKVGKINYHPISSKIDWKKYTEDVINLIKSYEVDYLIKDDLKMFIPKGEKQDTRHQDFPISNVR